MADLSDLLGDVYGNPDGPPIRHEGTADERASEELDGDLAAALDAALAVAPGTPAPAAPPATLDESGAGGRASAAPELPDLDAFLASTPLTAPAAAEEPAPVADPTRPVELPSLEDFLAPVDGASAGAALPWEADLGASSLSEGDDPFQNVEPRRPWHRHDDDILPDKRRGLGRARSASSAPAPSPATVSPAPAGSGTAKVRTPWIAAVLCLVTFGLYFFVWYHRVNRDLRSEGIDVKPALSLLAVTVGLVLVVPGLLSLFRTGNRIAELQRQRRVPPSSSGLIGALLCVVLLPIGVLYYQAELNKAA